MFLMLEDLSLWKELGRGWESISNLSRLSVEATLLEIKECFLVLCLRVQHHTNDLWRPFGVSLP